MGLVTMLEADEPSCVVTVVEDGEIVSRNEYKGQYRIPAEPTWSTK